MNKRLNKAQTQELFEIESILIGRDNAVPLYRVKELFGDRAAEFAYQTDGASNCFGIGDYNLPYLNYKGFQLAASFNNVKNIRKDLDKRKEKTA